MKILLINPPFDYVSPYLLISEPLSLGYLASYLRQYGHNVNILDGVAGKTYKKGNLWHFGLNNFEISQIIKEFKPDMVGITCTFSLRIDATLDIARLIKKIDKQIITVVGGIHPTIFPEETISHREVDYVVIGEGEESFLNLVRQIESRKNLSKINIDGCVYKSQGLTVVNNKTCFIQNLDSLPFPARDLLSMEFYMRKKTILYGLGSKRTASIITSRSCPMRCTFCSMHLSHGPKLRSRSAQNVFAELEELVKKYHVEEVFFMDDNLTFEKERIISLCKLIIRNKLQFRWNTPNGVRADRLDVELVRMMKKAGCVNICIGIESGSSKVRNEVIKKGLSEKEINKALKACLKVNLPVVGFFILGIPGETRETFQETINMVKTIPLSMIATSFFTPFPGTKLYDDCVQNGYIKPDYWKKINSFAAPVVETPMFNKQTLKKWEKDIYKQFFISHFWPIFFQTVTLKNQFLKLGMIKRFVADKFGIVIKFE